MADDVKVLREIAALLNSGRVFEPHSFLVDERALQTEAAIGILCARMADMIEREEQQEPASQSTGHPIEPTSYDEGWNAAIRAIEEKIGNDNALVMHRDGFLRLVLHSLRREPRK